MGAARIRRGPAEAVPARRLAKTAPRRPSRSGTGAACTASSGAACRGSEPKYLLPKKDDLLFGHRPLFIPGPAHGEVFLVEGYVDALAAGRARLRRQSPSAAPTLASASWRN